MPWCLYTTWLIRTRCARVEARYCVGSFRHKKERAYLCQLFSVAVDVNKCVECVNFSPFHLTRAQDTLINHVIEEQWSVCSYEKGCSRCMVIILDGSSDHGCAHIERMRHFDLLKAFGYIDRVVKSDFFRKRPILLDMCATCFDLPSYISTFLATLCIQLMTWAHYLLFFKAIATIFPESYLSRCWGLGWTDRVSGPVPISRRTGSGTPVKKRIQPSEKEMDPNQKTKNGKKPEPDPNMGAIH